MHIQKIKITNFRLLANVELLLEEQLTVIVGRNNSGKTSLTELFRRLLSDTLPTFRMEDFSLSAHECFWNAFVLKRAGSEPDAIRIALPAIEVKLTVSYKKAPTGLGLLTDLIIDLNTDCTEALLVIRYQLKDGDLNALFEDIDNDPTAAEQVQKTALCRALRDRIAKHYSCVVTAVDPGDPLNTKPVELSTVRHLIQSGFINAQRGLDDTTHRDINLLGKVLEQLLTSAASDAADPKDREIASSLETAVENMQQGIDGGFNKQLQDLLPAFTLFGYPGLSDPRLLTETTLDVQRLLKDHTKVHYGGINGVNLPEAYNGLGVRNLVFILLKLYEFFKLYKAEERAPGIHLIFIEEPEVHLHPQMQEVFIGKLIAIADAFATKFNDGKPWPVQFVVTTHSSHLANKAAFSAMRYFLATSDEHAGNVRSTHIKDLRSGLGGIPEQDQAFLHKYMTLTRCDLLFADKAILIEGMSERLLLPKMVEKMDVLQADGLKLSSQYLSIVEVGGAYAHLFFDLLNFLELRTLVITDLDSVDGNNDGKACRVSQGTRTSNACIKTWFNDPIITPAALLQKSGEDRTMGSRRLAYQIPEAAAGPCGRSFEDAFMLANQGLFGLAATAEAEKEAASWDKAQMISKKSDFAMEYAIDKTEWVVPRYIAEGLRWLAEGARGPAVIPPAPAVQPAPVDAAQPAQENQNV